MSRFEVEIRGTRMRKGGGVQPFTQTRCMEMPDFELESTPGSELKLKSTWVDLEGTVTGVTVRAEGQPDINAQLEEQLYVVVTRYVTDAFDRLRERPMAVFALGTASLTLTRSVGRVWELDPDEMADASPFKDKRGRIRLLRIMWPNSGEGGYVDAVDERTRFGSLFGTAGDLNADLDMNPLDAAGMALGISTPIEWG
jgi:hypothetical protein